jgi:hypothetical protein
MEQQEASTDLRADGQACLLATVQRIDKTLKSPLLTSPFLRHKLLELRHKLLELRQLHKAQMDSAQQEVARSG